MIPNERIIDILAGLIDDVWRYYHNDEIDRGRDNIEARFRVEYADAAALLADLRAEAERPAEVTIEQVREAWGIPYIETCLECGVGPRWSVRWSLDAVAAQDLAKYRVVQSFPWFDTEAIALAEALAAAPARANAAQAGES